MRRAVCFCLRGAVASSRSIASIQPLAGSRTVVLGAGFFLGGGTAEVSACRTVRRCTPYFSAIARYDISG